MIKTKKCIGVCRNVLSFAFAQGFRQYTLIPYTLNTCIFIFFALLLHASAYGAKPETGLIKHRRMENNPSPNAWYHLWVPPSYTPSEPLPLYIFLHGGHVGSGTADNIVDLRRIVPHMKNSITLFPNHIFWFWSHPDETIYVITIMEKLLDTYSIDRTRIYVMGSSMGGNGAMHFAARFPEMFAACAPMACWCRFIPVKQAAVMPIYSAHGKKDKSVPIKWARDIRRRLKGIKGLKLKYRELDCGHQLPMNVIKDAAAWISTFRNPRTFDIKKMKERARALPHARWMKQPKYQQAYCNARAWWLLTCKNEKLRAPEKALSLALKAVKLSKGKLPAFLDTLALAYSKNGKHKKAAETQEKAVSLLPKQTPEKIRTEFTQRLEQYRRKLNIKKSRQDQQNT